jgi:hypothetical protein
MKILYKPFGIIAGVIAAKLGQKLFTALWARLDDSPPPDARLQQASLPKVVGAKTLEGALMSGVAAAVDRASANSFHHLTGIWPGPKEAESH